MYYSIQLDPMKNWQSPNLLHYNTGLNHETQEVALANSKSTVLTPFLTNIWFEDQENDLDEVSGFLRWLHFLEV